MLRDHSALVAGPRSDPEVAALARQTAAERHARVHRRLRARWTPALAGRAPYLRRNLAVAVAAAEVVAGPLDPRDRRRASPREVPLPGRMELTRGRPADRSSTRRTTPTARRALAEALAGRRRRAPGRRLHRRSSRARTPAGSSAPLAPRARRRGPRPRSRTRGCAGSGRPRAPGRSRPPSSPRIGAEAGVDERRGGRGARRPRVARATRAGARARRGGARRRIALPSWLWIVRLAPSCCR